MEGHGPCVTSPRPETHRLEAKQLRLCLLSKRVEVLRQKSKVKRWLLSLTEKLTRLLTQLIDPSTCAKGRTHGPASVQPTLQLRFFMKTLAIILVGGAAKIAADGFFGVLTLLHLYTRPKGRPKIIFFCLLEYPHRSCLERRNERATASLQWRK